MNKYIALLNDKKLEEAEEYRMKSIPKTLRKFIPLYKDSNENEKRFSTLEKQQLWFSAVKCLNDPYEFKCMYINDEELKKRGYDDSILSGFHKIFDDLINKWSLVSLSAASIDNLPMWAYYTNNFNGFCVEYEVVNPDAIYEVGYEPERIPIASIMTNFCKEFDKMKERGEQTSVDVDFYVTLLRYQLHAKHASWKHEQEYRVLYPNCNEKGQNIDLNIIGLKTTRIIVGLNCTDENKERLNTISNKLGCGNILETKISGKHYTLLEE